MLPEIFSQKQGICEPLCVGAYVLSRGTDLSDLKLAQFSEHSLMKLVRNGTEYYADMVADEQEAFFGKAGLRRYPLKGFIDGPVLDLDQRGVVAMSLSNLGLALIASNHHDAAIQSLKGSVRLNPENPYAQLNLTSAYRIAGEATEAYSSMLAYLKGRVVARKGDADNFEKAMATLVTGYSSALAGKTEIEDYRRAEGVLLGIAAGELGIRPGDESGLTAAFERLKSLADDQGAHLAMKRYLPSAEGITEENSKRVNAPPSYQALGKLYRKTGFYPEAEECFKHILADEKSQRADIIEAAHELSLIKQSLGQHRESIRLLQRALNTLDDLEKAAGRADNQTRFILLQGITTNQGSLGQFEDALKTNQRALGLVDERTAESFVYGLELEGFRLALAADKMDDARLKRVRGHLEDMRERFAPILRGLQLGAIIPDQAKKQILDSLASQPVDEFAYYAALEISGRKNASQDELKAARELLEEAKVWAEFSADFQKLSKFNSLLHSVSERIN
jgi:tetratricopeptide (TPR) repeat protein